MNSKTLLALAVAVAIAGVGSPAFAQANHYRPRGTQAYDYAGKQAYDYAPQASQGASPSVIDPRWAPRMAGAGSLGYNQHNEVKN